MILSSRNIQNTNTKANTQFIPYNNSEILALSLGYVEVQDEQAWRGRYFIKAGKKWIHNIEALRKKLTSDYGYYITDEELAAPAPEGFGYDVEAYYTHNSSQYLSKNKTFQQVISKIRIN